ncbi:MAG: hypothetical protein AMJ88_19070 [Anaerolineae bacterium SM23_ 63]|nr:MAG: hypothetical protein AMJ88_19070 [Anaerolineae bacterium SM23_ 63]
MKCCFAELWGRNPDFWEAIFTQKPLLPSIVEASQQQTICFPIPPCSSDKEASEETMTIMILIGQDYR